MLRFSSAHVVKTIAHLLVLFIGELHVCLFSLFFFIFVKKLNAKRFFKTILKNSKKQTTFRRYTTPLSSQNDKS